METGTSECKLHYCTLASVLPVGIFYTDVAGYFLSVNDYWCEIAGITAVQAQGNSWVQVLYPDDRERVFAEWDRAAQEKIPFRCEYRVQRPDGQTLWVLGQAVAQKDETATVIGYIGTLTNITPYKQVQEELNQCRHSLEQLLEERTTELRQANEQLQQEIQERQRVEETQARVAAILEATTDFVATANNLNGRACYINKAGRELVGLETTGEILVNIPDFHPQREHQKIFNEMLPTALRDGVWRGETILLHCDGREIPVSQVVIAHKSEKGTVEFFSTIMRDISEYKRIETELLRANERFELATAAVDFTIYDWYIDKKSVQRSERLLKLLGYHPQEAEPTKEWWLDRIHPDERQRLKLLVSNALTHEKGYTLEYRIRHKDNRYLHICDYGLIVRNSDGRAVRLVGSVMDITQRKQAEERLRSTQEFLVKLLEYTPAPIYIVTADEQRYRLVNRAWEEFVGIGREEVIGYSIDQLFPPAVAQQFKAVNQQVIDTGAPVIAEEFVDVADGRHYFHTVKFPIKDALGQIEAVGGISLDITQRKQAEEALRQSEERFRQMAENIHEVFWMANPELTQMLYVSPAYEAIWGRTCASLYAQPRSFIEAIHPDDWERVLAAFEQHRQSGFSHEYRIVKPDGSVRWIWERGFPVRNQAGQLESFVGVSQDVSDAFGELRLRKQAEEALRESEARFRLLAENSTDMISRHTPEEGIFLYASPACQTLLGYAPEELVGHSAYEFFHPDDLAQIRKSHATILDLPVTYTVAYRHHCKDGHYIWLETTCRTIRDQQTGAILEIQSTSRDITERKQAEAALRQQINREQLMARMTQRIHQSLNLEKILNTTVAEVRQFLDCDRVLIYRLQSHQSGVVVVESVASGWSSISGTLINDCYFTDNYFQLYQQGRIQALEDIYTANLTPCHVDLLARFQVRANLVVPIVQDEGLWGLLVAQQCSGTRQWQPSEIDLLKSLATQSAIAIQKSELYAHSRAEIAQRQQAEAALQQQFLKERLIAQSAQRIRQSLNLEHILNTTVAEVRQFLECDRAIIFRFEPDWSGVVAVESVDEGWPPILGAKFYDHCFEVDYVQPYQEGRIQVLEDIYAAGLSQCHIDLLAQFQVRAKLVVPILQGEQLWGLLVAYQCRGPRQWQQFEIDLLKLLSTQVAIALQQAELYQQSCRATQTALTQAQQLEQAMIELQKTQAQLVQSEKMSSLGQLVAGVAHEINNPVTFISANLSYAEKYTQDLLGLIQLYQQQYPHPTPEISSEIEAIELDFLIEDLPKLLDSMNVGAQRICEIISALRNFSRHAEAEIKAVDIHEGLDSTLMILRNRLKAQGKHPEIQVIKEYGNLPKVECYVGQLNQVFMNLLSNAIDAIASRLLADANDALEELNVESSKVESLTPYILITTEVLNNREVAIRIADNGLGMTQQVKRRIFDPFYSTKAVGTGMGLGLSISYQIVVEKHGGQLQCQSILGQGTEFLIQIPLWQRGSQI